MGWSATYETYLAFLSKFPLVDKDWELQLLPITAVRDAGPAAGLVPPPPAPATTVAALSMPATTSFAESFVPFGGLLCDTYEANSLTTNFCPQALRCQHCNDRYEQEVASIIRGSGVTADAHQEGLPSLLQNGSMMGSNNEFDAVKVRDDQMVLSTKILNLEKKWNEYCVRIHQGCNRINRDPCQLFPHHIGVRVDRERCANPNQSAQTIALQRDIIKPCALSSPYTNITAKSISAPDQINADLVLNLQVRQSRSNEPLQSGVVPFQHINSSNYNKPEESSAAPVTTDLVLATPRGSSFKDSSSALCKRVEDIEETIQLMPNKVDDLNLKPPHLSIQPYTCSKSSSSNWEQTSPSALHSTSLGGTSAFGQWQRPSPLATQSFDLSNYKLLMEHLFKVVGRQEEALSAICASIVRCRSMERRRGANKKNDIWFSFYGPDSIAKRRVGVALAELMHGSSGNLIYLDLSLNDWGNPSFRGKRATDCIFEELRKKRRSVIFLDNIDKADCLVQESLIHAMETGRYKDLHGGRVTDLNDSIVVLSTRMIQGCQDASLGVEEGNAFSEEKAVAARGHQLKIIVEPGTTNIGGGNVVVSSRHSLGSSEASSYSSKRKLHISDGQEKTEESASTSKRLHRTSSIPFDLNLPGDDEEAHDDGDEDKSSGSHENYLEGSVGNLLRWVDGSINFKPFDFGKLCEDILQEFSNTTSKILGTRGCRLEIDAGAMEQVVAAAWASDSHENEKRPVRTWVEQVFGRSLEQVKMRCENLSSCTLRLVSCEVKEDGFGALLPSRIILDW